MDITKLTKEECRMRTKTKRYLEHLWHHYHCMFSRADWEACTYNCNNSTLEWLHYWNLRLEIGADITWPAEPAPHRTHGDKDWTHTEYLELIAPLYKRLRSEERKGMCTECVHQWPMKMVDRRGSFVWKFCTKHSMFCTAIARNCKGPEKDASKRGPLPEMPEAICTVTRTPDPSSFFERIAYESIDCSLGRSKPWI